MVCTRSRCMYFSTWTKRSNTHWQLRFQSILPFRHEAVGIGETCRVLVHYDCGRCGRCRWCHSGLHEDSANDIVHKPSFLSRWGWPQKNIVAVLSLTFNYAGDPLCEKGIFHAAMSSTQQSKCVVEARTPDDVGKIVGLSCHFFQTSSLIVLMPAL